MHPPTPDFLRERLKAAAGSKDRFGSTATAVLETAALIAAADQDWEKSTVTAFQDQQKIHKKVWDKLIGIHRDQRLRPLQDSLPASYTALYALVVMKDEELDAAISDDLLKKKNLSSRAILDWTKAYRLKGTGIEQEIPMTLVLKQDLSPQRHQELLEALKDVATQYGAEVREGKRGLKQSEVKAEARVALAGQIEEELILEIGTVVLNAPDDLKTRFGIANAAELIEGSRSTFTGFFQNLVGKVDGVFWRDYGRAYCLKIARDYNLTDSRAERFQLKDRIQKAIVKWSGDISGFEQMAKGILSTYMSS
jgi:hypothetical protein